MERSSNFKATEETFTSVSFSRSVQFHRLRARMTLSGLLLITRGRKYDKNDPYERPSKRAPNTVAFRLVFYRGTSTIRCERSREGTATNAKVFGRFEVLSHKRRHDRCNFCSPSISYPLLVVRFARGWLFVGDKGVRLARTRTNPDNCNLANLITFLLSGTQRTLSLFLETISFRGRK